MRRFWGRADATNALKFSRDDEQILALNYENLCDGDYLSRLFAADNLMNKDDSPQTSSTDNSKVSTDTGSSVQDLAEDILVFGDDQDIGKQFYQKRLQKEINTSTRLLDPLAKQISHQVLVFDHMTNLMVSRFSMAHTSSSSKSQPHQYARNASSTNLHLPSLALRCCLTMIDSDHVDSGVICSTVKPILQSLMLFFNPEIWSNPTQSLVISSEQTKFLRKIFQRCLRNLHALNKVELSSWQRHKFQDNTTSVLLGIYGYLTLGLLGGSSSDIIVAVHYLMLLMITAEEKVESMLSQLKDVASSTAVTTCNSNNSSVLPLRNNNLSPAGRISNKSKQRPKLSVKNEDTIELKVLPEESKERNQVDSDLENRSSSGLALKYSNTKDQKEKSSAPIGKISDYHKDISVKGKLGGSKTIKGMEGKMLHEFLEKGGTSIDSIANNQAVIVANHVMIEPARATSRSNNRDKEFSSNKASNSISPRTNFKRIEKEIKDSLQTALRLPKMILDMMNDYCTVVDGNLSTKRSNNVTTTKGAQNALPSKGLSTYVWSCGQNSYGELGLGDVNVRKTFTKVSSLDEKSIISIGAGNEHSLFVTKDGKLFTAGYNENGQCGIGSTQQVRQPAVVQALEDEEIQQVFVFNGCEHTIALTRDGKVYSFGYNYRGQLGLGSTNSESLPRPIRAILSRRVVLAACSYHHTVFLCGDGTLFSCGRNDSGQLGHGDTADKKTPQAILSAPKHVVSISCGQFHTVASTAQGVVYACGKNDYGQLGMESSNHVKVFSKIQIGTELDSVVQVCCGYYHTLLVTSAGVVAGFGRNDYGQLGLGHSLPKIFQCTVIPSLRDKGVTMLSAGCYHSIAVTYNGMLYVFGRNNHGQLATGDLEERHTPHPVDDFVGQKILSVAAGFYHTLVLTGEGSYSQKDCDIITSLPSHVLKVENAFDNGFVVNTEHDPKQLASMLRKDLELLCSYDIPDRHVTGPSTLDVMSSISCRDLFTIFVKNISNFDQKDHPLMQLQCSDDDLSESTLLHVLKSSLSVIVVTWEVISSHNHINLPLSVDDALVLLRKLLPIISKILRLNGHLINQDGQINAHVGDGNIASLLAENDTSLLDRIVSILGSFTSKAGINDIQTLVAQIREILIYIYYNCQLGDTMRSDSESLTCAICDVLVTANDIFFNGIDVYMNHLITIVNKIQMIGDIDGSDSNHHLKLLIALGRVYQSAEDATSLFHKYPDQAIIIFRTLLNCYNFFSKMNVEKRLRGVFISNRSVDIRRVSTVLEQTIYNMLKCAIPIILKGPAEEFTGRSSSSTNCEIIIQMIKDAECLLDLVMSKNFSDETLGLLRFGTLMPSILPTTLLYAIGSAKKSVVIPGIIDALKPLVEKLQGICRCELQHYQIKSMIDKKNAESSTHDPLKEEELSDCFCEEFLFVKREQNLISWWFRLLKISVTLLSKSTLNCVGSVELNAQDVDVFQEVERFKVLYAHQIWNNFCFQHNDVQNRANNSYLAEQLSCVHSTHCSSASFLEYRHVQKLKDPMYRMIVTSSQHGNITGPTLESFEGHLFSIITELNLPTARPNHTKEVAFQYVSELTKQVFSKRSALVTNSSGKSWTEILTIIGNIIIELCEFTKNLQHSFSIASPLPLPKGSRKLWRKAVMLIVCLKRWRDCSNRRISRVSADLSDFVTKGLNIFTNGLSCVPDVTFASSQMKMFYSGLYMMSKKLESLEFGLNFTKNYLGQIWPVTLKSDLLADVTTCIREKYSIEKHELTGAPLLSCCSMETFVGLKRTLDNFSDHLISMVERCFSPSYGFTLIELQYLIYVVKALETMLCMPLLNKAVSKNKLLSFKTCTRLIIVLYEKYRHWSMHGEERSQNKKGASIRERSLASKKALFSILSYLQSVIIYCSDSPNECRPNLLYQAVVSFNALISYLQTSRIEESLNSGEDCVFGNSLDKDSSNKAGPKENAKKRCQDLILKPMEFSRNCEGVAIQGEKLLNNCKGMDYSIATWVMITNRPVGSNKSSFILGKVSHNEVWPLVLLKNDGKLELLYGHNNENEKTTSEAAVPLHTWTHIAVVVEQKKIKLFVNGILDCQINTTKGNARAILFPLVLGSCPANIRTRVNSVKEGFEGMLAQCKYYSRALSPIHVKVIYDHGPPETTDVSAKVIYQVIGTMKVIMSKINLSCLQTEVQETAELAQLVFVSDSNRRNRYGALDLLRVILEQDALDAMKISGVRYGFRTIEHVQRRSVFETLVAPKGSSFKECFVYYFLRIAGTNWLQHHIPLDHLYNVDVAECCQSSEDLEDIVLFTPSCCFNKVLLEKLRGNSRVVTPNGNQLGDRFNYHDEPYGEISYHVISVLFQLASCDSWKDSIEHVVKSILSRFVEEISDGTSAPSRMNAIDIFGVSLLLGGVSSGAYLGALVANTFEDGLGRIVQINNTINGATIFSRSSEFGTTARASKVRLSDISYEDHTSCVGISQLTVNVGNLLVKVLEALSPFVLILTKDYLAINYADSNFLTKSVLRCMRPIETFVFFKLYKALHRWMTHNDSLINWESCPKLLSTLKSFSTSTLEISIPEVEPATNISSSTLSTLWFSNMKFFASVPDKVVSSKFPSDQDDRYFLEFLQKQLGLNLDAEIKEEFSSMGQWFSATSLLSMNQQFNADEPGMSNDQQFSISDRSAIGRLQQSCNYDIMLTDRDCANALVLFYHIRRELITEIRYLLTSSPFASSMPSMIGNFLSKSLSQDFVLWSSLSPTALLDQDWISTQKLKQMFVVASSPWVAISSELTNTGTSPIEITKMIVGAIKFSMLSLLQSSYYKTKDNLLVSTDFFNNLLKTLYYWIEVNSQGRKCEESMDFECIGYVILKNLLPTLLPGYDNEILELKILQVCVFCARKLSLRLITKAHSSNGNAAHNSNVKMLLDVVKGMHFALIRARAQEQVMKYKSHNFNSVGHLAYNLTQLVASLEFIQRRSSVVDSSAIVKLMAANNLIGGNHVSTKNQAHLMVAKLQSTETSPPKLLTIRSYSIDLDLTQCASSLRTADNMEIFQLLAAAYPTLLDNIVIEVALGVNTGNGTSSTTDIVFETVYCGSCHRILQSGLMPDSSYQLRCRAYFGSIPLSWSSIIEFQTEKGLLFSFDPLKCGADIVLSEDGLTASYAGDDTWSTVLGSRSFSSGVTTWEIRVNQSATAYIFVGVATSAADLNSFLGGCTNGWGFIGEQALYHNREKVKVYGEPFTTGDLIGVTLDLNVGTLSFSKNHKPLGVAFEKIYGDLYPAVAFYNVGQELQILPEGFKTSCGHEPIPISPARLSMDDVSLLTELVLSLHCKATLSHRLAVMVAEHCNQWCTAVYVRCRAVSRKELFLATESPLLKRFNLVVGERVRTFYGVAEVAGTAYNRVWFRVNPAGEVWFFTNQQILEGKAKKLFCRCSYSQTEGKEGMGSHGSTIGPLSSTKSSENLYVASYDAATILDLLDPLKWTEDMDAILLAFLAKQSEAAGVEPWKISSEKLFENYRALQQQLTRIVLTQSGLTQKWGITGPKRKAVVARLGLLRLLNQLLDMYLPFLISDNSSHDFESNKPTIVDDFTPAIETFTVKGSSSNHETIHNDLGSESSIYNNRYPLDMSNYCSWPSYTFSWDSVTSTITDTQDLWFGPLHSIRRLIFNQTKICHFLEVLKKTSTRPAKTEDDYDYPENLPHVKINRLKAFRAREASELMHIPGNDLLPYSMFCQLWFELRQYNSERLRISYTHPMDDGQSRTFKIKFEGEGVDDYGGPYREVFQQICTELQLLEPSAAERGPHTELKNPPAMSLSMGPMSSHSQDETQNYPSSINGNGGKTKCFLPLLMPTPNWVNDVECQEKYKFMFDLSIKSQMKLELCRFMGQLVGIAIRSKITLDLAFPSYVWKCIVNEKLCEGDLASFDQSGYDLVLKLNKLYRSWLNSSSQKELGKASTELIDGDMSILEELTWSYVGSDGRVYDLVTNGRNLPVKIDDVGRYLTSYMESRFNENKVPIQMFRQGLVSIIPESAISLLTWEEFQSIVCGSKVIDIDRLRENTEYDDDVSQDDQHIIHFWEVLHEFSEIEKSAFLRFVWARPSLPPKGVEFTQKMRILSATADESAISNSDLILPKAHTCFFSINLPKYSSKQIMADKLRYAIFNCTEMDGDFRTTDIDIPGWSSALTSSISGANVTLQSSQSVELFHTHQVSE